MTTSPSLSRSNVRQLLEEDGAAHDLTTLALISPKATASAQIVAKAAGIIAGVDVAIQVFRTVDPSLRFRISRRDGTRVRPGQTILTIRGRTRSVLAAERTALNFLGHLSGVATLTDEFVRRTQGTRANIYDTRKTIPGLRALQKYAVRIGGGRNHRMGLHDAVLIKTNHLLAYSRQHTAPRNAIKAAIAQAKRKTKRQFVEVEVGNMVEFKAALAAKPNVILLDNWPLQKIKKAVYVRSCLPSAVCCVLEVSGGVSLKNVRAIARTGVDRISIGQLTHSAPSLDLSLQITKP